VWYICATNCVDGNCNKALSSTVFNAAWVLDLGAPLVPSCLAVVYCVVRLSLIKNTLPKYKISYSEALWSQVSGLATSGATILSFTYNDNSRSRICVSNQTNALFMLELYSRDVTMVRITYISEARRNFHLSIPCI
jgi:hypothetical protein